MAKTSGSPELLGTTRASAYRITVFCTGYWPIGDHTGKFGIPSNLYYGEEGENVKWLFCDYPAKA